MRFPTSATQVAPAPELHGVFFVGSSRSAGRQSRARATTFRRFRQLRRRREESNEGVVAALPSTPSSTSTTTTTPTSTSTSFRRQQQREDLPRSVDIVVVGSGIGGLCSAALLSRYGFSVAVIEAHDRPGGAAHSFSVRAPRTAAPSAPGAAPAFEFDAGPSFFAGLGGPLGDKTSNPLKQVLNAVGEEVSCVDYDRWTTHVGRSPRSPSPIPPSFESFDVVADGRSFSDMVLSQGGARAHAQWLRLESAMRPLQLGAASFPAAALRGDAGVVLSCARFGPTMLRAGLVAPKLVAPFSKLVESAGVTDPWLLSWLDLECFVLSGMRANATIAAEMAYMFYERNGPSGGRGRKRLPFDYPLGGGSKAIVDALVRGIEKHGGRVFLDTRVEEIAVDAESGRASGVRVVPLRGGRARGNEGSPPPAFVEARKAVVSNASAWDTARLLPRGAAPRPAGGEAPAPSGRRAVGRLRSSAERTPALPSFVHLHLGIDAEGLPPGGAEQAHHLFVHDLSQSKIEEPQNVCILSIPTVFDPSLAPRDDGPSASAAGSSSARPRPGNRPPPRRYATVHAYTAGNEPYELWEGVERGTREYDELKEERSRVLWKCVDEVVPGARERAVVSLVASPKTHERFLNRHRGTYGPGISASTGSFPGPKTGVPGLLRVGDSCAPGIGVPAAAASGMIAANTIAGVWDHLKLLDSLGL